MLVPVEARNSLPGVRLRQGDMNETTVFSDDPVAVARRWVEAGARRLHIVDLDGAFKGETPATFSAARIQRAAPA